MSKPVVTKQVREKGAAFTPEMKKVFCEELARSGHLNHSSKFAGVTYWLMNQHREGGYAEDQDFMECLKEAMDIYTEGLKKEAYRRAVEGWEERPIIDKTGKIVGHVHKYSDTLLLALLKKHDPEFRDKIQVDATTTNVTPANRSPELKEVEELYKSMSPDEQKAYKASLRAIERVRTAAAKKAADVEEAPAPEQTH